jgi:hypothetical protein
VTGLVADLAGKAATDDPRLSDARTPVAHATSHAAGQADALTLTQAQISNLVADLAAKAALAGATFTGDLTVQKAAPLLRLVAQASGAPSLITDALSAAAPDVYWYLRTGTSTRWLFGKNGTESGSNAGSNFSLLRYSDAGAGLGEALGINRSTGKTTLGAVGAAAGLELGANGPRQMAGTGSPEGVVTAPVGSTWIDTNATTGAIRWIKASGTGNTGWIVAEGDTGWRTVWQWDGSAATVDTWPLGANFEGRPSVSGLLRVRRIRDTVHLLFRSVRLKAGQTNGLLFANAMPSGWAATDYQGWAVPTDDVSVAGGLTFASGLSNPTLAAAVAGRLFGYISVRWIAPDTWPTVLP